MSEDEINDLIHKLAEIIFEFYLESEEAGYIINTIPLVQTDSVVFAVRAVGDFLILYRELYLY